MSIKLRGYSKKIAGDTETPITLYKKFVGNDVGVLLESRDSAKGRYSFIARDPFAVIKRENGKNITADKNGVVTDTGNFLDTVKAYMKNVDVFVESNIPFCGGAVGTIGYDVIKQYEKIPQDNPDTIGTPEAHVMFIKEMVVFDHYHQHIEIVVLEEETEKGEYSANMRILEIEKELKNKIEFEDIYDSVSAKKNKDVIGNTTKEEFMKKVAKAKQYIYEGDIFQVVLSQRWKMETEEEPFNLYRKLRALNPSPYLFYLNFGDYQVAGSSPEMLVELKKDKIYTCPIAGTRKRGKNLTEDRELAEDLLADPKEQAEHVMLVDLARNDIGRMSKIGTVKVKEFMQVHYYSHVMHLVSLVEGTIRNGYDAFSVLASAIPAGTLSGAPKIRAMEIIEELETEKRGIYGGAVGYFSFNGDMDTCIAIRTMVIKENHVYMQAGAGIVADSDPESEYEECRNKVRALVTAIEKKY